MGYLDKVLGRKEKKDEKKAEPQLETLSTAPPPSTSSVDLLRDTAPTSAPDSPLGVQPSGRLYDPYEGISTVVGGKRHAFKLSAQPEFVFEEEAATRRRGFSENLQFYTGLGFFGGSASGVGRGLYDFATKPAIVQNESLKLKTNRFLNAAGSYAKPWGNGCGILAIYFSGAESIMFNQIEGVLPDPVITMAAGAASGALFRSPRGPRQAAAAGLVGAVGGVGLAALRTIFPSL